MVPVANFLVYLGLQWWAFWYPGAEPGGGGYIAQRIFSARDEKQGLLSVLWFNIAHYAIRPWPWIVTGLAVIVLYPGLKHPETGYMMVLNAHLPHQYRGIAMAGFLAAFMSTIATQLNWGASYLVADFYRRFLRRRRLRAALRQRLTRVYGAAGDRRRRGCRCICHPSPADGKWCCEIGAGTGAVYILRWYWWRINAWSEISAMACSLLVTLVLTRWQPFSGNESLVFAKSALTTTLVTTAVWLSVTFLTSPEPDDILTALLSSGAAGRARLEADCRPCAGDAFSIAISGRNLGAWALGCVMVYACLFGTGKLLLHQTGTAALLLLISAISAGLALPRRDTQFQNGTG